MIKFLRLKEGASSMKVNGDCEKSADEKKSLPPDQMTSADYYFDSYAHFGKDSYAHVDFLLKFFAKVNFITVFIISVLHRPNLIDF